MGDRQLVQRILQDYRTAPIEDRMKALLTLIEKAARQPNSVTREDVAAVRSAGWTDEAIYDAITVCALFQFFNTWVDASGVADLPDYTPSGKRLATLGYAPSRQG